MRGERLICNVLIRIVRATGPEVKRLGVGDRVFGFTWRNRREKAHQEVVCAPENLLGVVPEGVSCKVSNLPSFGPTISILCKKVCALHLYHGMGRKIRYLALRWAR